MEDDVEVSVCSCGSTDNVTLTIDPFAAEIYGDMTEVWMCANCYYESSMDI